MELRRGGKGLIDLLVEGGLGDAEVRVDADAREHEPDHDAELMVLVALRVGHERRLVVGDGERAGAAKVRLVDVVGAVGGQELRVGVVVGGVRRRRGQLVEGRHKVSAEHRVAGHARARGEAVHAHRAGDAVVAVRECVELRVDVLLLGGEEGSNGKAGETKADAEHGHLGVELGHHGGVGEGVGHLLGAAEGRAREGPVVGDGPRDLGGGVVEGVVGQVGVRGHDGRAHGARHGVVAKAHAQVGPGNGEDESAGQAVLPEAEGCGRRVLEEALERARAEGGAALREGHVHGPSLGLNGDPVTGKGGLGGAVREGLRRPTLQAGPALGHGLVVTPLALRLSGGGLAAEDRGARRDGVDARVGRARGGAAHHGRQAEGLVHGGRALGVEVLLDRGLHVGALAVVDDQLRDLSVGAVDGRRGLGDGAAPRAVEARLQKGLGAAEAHERELGVGLGKLADGLLGVRAAVPERDAGESQAEREHAGVLGKGGVGLLDHAGVHRVDEVHVAAKERRVHVVGPVAVDKRLVRGLLGGRGAACGQLGLVLRDGQRAVVALQVDAHEGGSPAHRCEVRALGLARDGRHALLRFELFVHVRVHRVASVRANDEEPA
mmetsp:Transcript_298/g.974  ORF Transcript_298/g.974 Transcript_298/m.974 type:complete len:607 (-) Transcript_298:663-2483(-)